jgi:hypothetical protein
MKSSIAGSKYFTSAVKNIHLPTLPLTAIVELDFADRDAERCRLCCYQPATLRPSGKITRGLNEFRKIDY